MNTMSRYALYHWVCITDDGLEFGVTEDKDSNDMPERFIAICEVMTGQMMDSLAPYTLAATQYAIMTQSEERTFLFYQFMTDTGLTFGITRGDSLPEDSSPVPINDPMQAMALVTYAYATMRERYDDGLIHYEA